MNPTSGTRRLSLIALLTALAIVLNMVVIIPAPYAQYLVYGVWEIPILLAFLLLGFWGGTTVLLLNTLYLYRLTQMSVLGPILNLLAVLSMTLGVLAVQKVGTTRKWRASYIWIGATALGGLTRTSIMTLVNTVVLILPPPLGFALPPESLPATLILIGFFNLTTTLYAVPLAFSALRAIADRSRVLVRERTTP